MNLGTLKTHVSNRVGNDAISAVLTEFCNQIQYDMASRYHWSWRMSLPVTVNTIPNQNYLNTSAYFPNLGDPWDAVNRTTPAKMAYTPNWNINFNDPTWILSSAYRQGSPTNYSFDIANQRLWLYPVPDKAYSLQFQYLQNPSEISNTSSTLFIPSKYHYIVAAGMESLAWQMDEDLQSAAAANQRYEAGIARAIEEEQQLPDAQPIFQTLNGGYVDYSNPFSDI